MTRTAKRGKRPRGRERAQQGPEENRPLPTDTRQFFERHEALCHNTGLLLDRYVPWRPGWKLEGRDKGDCLGKLATKTQNVGGLVEANYGRWRQIVEAAGATPNKTWFAATTDWRMVVGLGGGHVLETVLTLHRVYGFPIIPGSALKGMTRAWVELEVEPGADVVTAVFGTSPEVRPMQAGRVVFFDAVPTRAPKLELDVMNPHYSDYYSKKADSHGLIPPGDYLSPSPVYFLTVAGGCEFAFAVASRNGNEMLAKTAAGWLKDALKEMGVGAKTVAGYGYWEID